MPVPPPPAAPAETSGDRSALSGRVALAVGMLLVASGALHIIGLFPAQGTHYAAASNGTSQVVEQAILAAGWLAAALAVLSRRPFSVAACLGAAGIGFAEVGLLVANFAQVAASTTLGAGAWLLFVAWIPGLVGALMGLGASWRSKAVVERPGGPRPVLGMRRFTLAVATLVVAVVLGVALLPGWDHYVLISSRLNRTLAIRTLGSAFAKGTPAAVLAGDLLSAVAFALLPIVAVLWRPVRSGVLLSGGVLVVVTSQVVSAIAGFHESPSFFGFPSGTISRFGLQLHSSLTGWFVVELIAGVVLLALLVLQWRQAHEDWLLSALPFGAGGLGSGRAVAYGSGGWPGPAAYPQPGSYPQPAAQVPQADPPRYR